MNTASLTMFYELRRKFGVNAVFMHIVEDGYYYSVTIDGEAEAHTFPFSMTVGDVPAFVKVFKIGREEQKPRQPKAKPKAKKEKQAEEPAGASQ